MVGQDLLARSQWSYLLEKISSERNIPKPLAKIFSLDLHLSFPWYVLSVFGYCQNFRDKGLYDQNTVSITSWLTAMPY